MKRIALGRHVFGLAAIGYGVIALIWHDPNHWQQLRSLGNFREREALVYIAAAIEIFGGLAIQWPRTARVGAVALGALSLVYSMLLVPSIIAKPQEIDRWLNPFYQLSLVSAALIVVASTDRSSAQRSARTAWTGRLLFGICVVSFTIEQAVELRFTASLVPRWIPPGQMFWAIATTIAFALAAIAILSGRSAQLAARCLTAMLIGFGLLVWMPVCLAAPNKFPNWAENVENLAIAAAAWIVADFFSQTRPASTAAEA